MKLLPVLAFLLFAFTSSAQMNYSEGYVILKGNKKVVGKIKSTPPSTQSLKVTFKTDKGHVKTYTPNEIKAWGTDKKNLRYESKGHRISATKVYAVFMRRICDGEGPVKLYEYWNSSTEFGFTQTFLERKKTMKEVKSTKFRKNISNYFSDNLELKKAIEAKKYKRKQLLEIVKRYNSWAKAQ